MAHSSLSQNPFVTLRPNTILVVQTPMREAKSSPQAPTKWLGWVTCSDPAAQALPPSWHLFKFRMNSDSPLRCFSRNPSTSRPTAPRWGHHPAITRDVRRFHPSHRLCDATRVLISSSWRSSHASPPASAAARERHLAAPLSVPMLAPS